MSMMPVKYMSVSVYFYVVCYMCVSVFLINICHVVCQMVSVLIQIKSLSVKVSVIASAK